MIIYIYFLCNNLFKTFLWKRSFLPGKDYFHENGEGLKEHFFKKDTAIKNLRYAIDRYSETTSTLIKRYIEAEKLPQGELESFFHSKRVTFQNPMN